MPDSSSSTAITRGGTATRAVRSTAATAAASVGATIAPKPSASGQGTW